MDIVSKTAGRVHLCIPLPATIAGFNDLPSDRRRHRFDPRRTEFRKNHFIQPRLIMLDYVDVRGYIAWSLMHNFEWRHGYSKRFGLPRVDYETQKRTVKDTGEWYAKVVRRNEVADQSPLVG